MRILPGDRSLYFYIIIILLFSIFLLNLPLAGVLGYEFSALSSILLVILSGIYLIRFLKGYDLKSGSKKFFYKQLIKVYAIFLVIPLLAGLIKSIFGLSCPVIDGILFYLFITCPAVIIGVSLGIVCFSISRKFAVILFLFLVLLIALIPILEIYFNPQVYFYNPLIGFFPGTIYDEGLSVNQELIWYRVINLIFFGLIFLLLVKAAFNEKVIQSKYILSGALLLSILFIIFSPLLGYSTSEGRLKNELNGKIETEHFIIHYSKEINEDIIKVSALHHEYYYSELSSFFKTKLRDKITSFVFHSSGQKGELFGAENADVAKPWLRQIYTTYDNYNTTLKHELAHVISGEFSEGLFKVAGSFNPALIEGIATAAHPVYDENSIEYLAAIAFKHGYKINVTNLFSSFNFFGSVSSLSYVYSGAFSKYLIDNYGIEKFKKVYADPDFNNVYGKSLSSLENEFNGYLRGFDVSNEEHTAHYYFGRKSIFQKVCPRYVADKITDASEYYHNGEYREAADIFAGLYNLSSSYVPLSGWINSLIELKQVSMADSILHSEIESFKNTGYYYNLELTLADISVRLGNYRKADSLYNRLVLQNPGRGLFYIANLRRDLLTWDDLLSKYVAGSETDKYIILKELNSARFYYSTFPVLVDLSRLLNENYELFLRQFRHTIIVNNYSASYGTLKLSGYALENLDFEKARRMAALSLRYNADYNYSSILNENMNRINWFRNNSKKLLDNMTIE